MTYQVNERKVLYHFNRLNNDLFEGKIPQPKLRLFNYMRPDVYARAGGNALDLLKNYYSLEFFKEILAHEMIHLFQTDVLGIPATHYHKYFWNWKQFFNNYGLRLLVRY